MSKMSKHCLDTSVISLLLNGALWRRAPYNLMRVRLNLAVICQKYGLEKVPEHDTEVSRAISAHKWNAMHSKDIKILAPPTATFELTQAAQVSTSLYFIVLSLDMRFCLSHPTNSIQGGSGYLVYSELCLSYYK